MTKLLKIGIPIMVAVFILGIGIGLALARGNDASVLTGTTVAYAADNAGYAQCPYAQYAGCPFAGNGGGYCAGPGAGCCGRGGLSGDSDDSYLPPCHRSQ